jgi:hypothetical protein
MADFSNFQQLEIKGHTAKFSMAMATPGPNGFRPVIIGRPASHENRAYRDEMLYDIGERFRASGGRVQLSADQMDQTRAKSRKMYAQFVICGWENVFDASGQEVPFSGEAATQFIAALPDWIFDEMRHFFEEPANFKTPLADAGLVAGN